MTQWLLGGGGGGVHDLWSPERIANCRSLPLQTCAYAIARGLLNSGNCCVFDAAATEG